MKHLIEHRHWLGLLCVAALLYFVAMPLIGYWQKDQLRYAQKIAAERVKTEQSLNQLKNDIATAQKLSGQMDTQEVERLLAPVDRLKVAAMLEHQAAAARLQNFTYTLAPEQKVVVTVPGTDAQELMQSEITLNADMPLDMDAYALIDNIQHQLPGRAALRALTLERAGGADAPIKATNLHMTARLEWLSAGAGKTIVGGL